MSPFHRAGNFLRLDILGRGLASQGSLSRGMLRLGMLSLGILGLGIVSLGPLGGSVAIAQSQRVTFERMAEADGFPDGLVTAILQDRRGFMWFGTSGGLARYDGYEYVHFHHDPMDSASIGAFLQAEWLFEDSRGRIWVGTYGGGLNRYDPLSDAFTRFRHDPEDPRTIGESDLVNYVHEDRSGYIWIGFTNSGLDRYDPRTGHFTHYRHDPDDPSSLSDDRVRVIYEDRHGVLWIGTGDPFQRDRQTGGLNRYVPERDAFARYRHDPLNANSLADNGVQVVVEDSRGTLWIGTGGNELHAYDRARDAFTRFTYHSEHPIGPRPPRSRREGEANSPVEPFVAAVLEDREGMLWIGSHLHGVDRYDPVTGTQVHFEHDPADPTSLGDNGVFRMYESHDGTIWVGTFGGLYKIDAGGGRFREFRHDPNDPSSIGPYVVADLHVDREGDLWTGTNRGGLQKLDRESGTFTSFPLELAGGATRDYSVSTVYEDRSGTLWAGLFNAAEPAGMMAVLDRRSGRVVPAGPALQSPIVAIHEDDEGVLWIGTLEGLYRYDRSDESLSHFPHARISTRGPVVSYTIVEGDNGVLWLGTEAGLLKFDRQSTSVTTEIEEIRVTALQESDRGGVWVATKSDGLLLYEPERSDRTGDDRTGDDRKNNDRRGDTRTSYTRTSYTASDGLAHNAIGIMLQDDDGFLWLNTERGLSRFDVERRTFQSYDLAAGLPGYGYTSSGARGLYGELYFGGTGGIVSVFPHGMSSTAPRVALTALTYIDRERRGGRPAAVRVRIPHEGTTRLMHAQNDVTFGYVGLHFSHPTGNRFAYRMDGYDEEWRDAGSQRSATYTNLSPGTYTFRVKSASADGIWSDGEATFAFVILPPWWQTGWAYALFAALMLAGVFAVDRIQRRRLISRERAAAAVREAELRAEALEVKNRHAAIALEKARELEHLNAQLEANQTQLELNQAQLEAQNHSLLELDEAKSRFFANISHEFRTPLALILGPVRDALRDGHALDAHDLDRIRRNAQRLLRLINQLLDLSRLDACGETVQPKHGDLADFLRRLTLSFTSRAEREGIALSFAAEPEPLPTAFDRDKLEKIVSNLLSNAFTFTPSGGKVALYVRALDGAVEMSVRDTGPGVPRDEIPRLFDRFYQVDASPTRRHEGSGIGLALVKELVELHGGSVSVESHVGFGTTFSVTLPLSGSVDEALPLEYVPEESDTGRIDEPDAATVPAHESDDRPAESTRSTGRSSVLVVEDNADLRDYLRGILQEDYDVVEARDGAEGLETARRVVPELIITDVMMPRMDGFALTRAVRSDEDIGHVPVILLTAKADRDSLIDGIEEGADDYLPKPFDAEELLARVESLIEIRHLLRKRFSGEVLLGPSGISVQSADAAFVESVREAIEAGMKHSNYGVDQLADDVSLSARQLQRRLKALTKLTAAGYIRMMRLARAAQLLEQDAGQISEIAYRVGYRDVDHFSKIFKQVHGVVPSAYGSAEEGLEV